MFSENGGRPGDERGFVHKKLLGIGKRALGVGIGFIPGVSTARDIISTGRSLLRGGRRARATVPRTLTARVTETSTAQKQLGADMKFPGFSDPRFQPQLLTTDVSRGGGSFRPGGPRSVDRQQLTSGPCDFPMVLDSAGRCRMPTSGEFGGEQFGVGAAVMGRYGAAIEPGSQIIDRAICLKGMQLGDDGLCYNKAQITNKQRMWPAGRKPLLSGGDMRAISIASRAGRRMELATKRLQRMGMMKKPARRLGPRAHAHAKPIAAVSV